MQPILIIKIYEDIDKKHEIINNHGELIETIDQLKLYQEIRNAISLRMLRNNESLKIKEKINDI